MFDDIISEDFTREDKAIVYAIKTLNELVDKGIVNGQPFEITDKGFEMIVDFEPTDEELKEAMEKLSIAGYIG
jgi:malate/lactate dehydrogenase